MDADRRNDTGIFRYTDVEYTPEGHTDAYRWDDFLGIAGGHVYSAMDTIDMVSTGGQYEGDEPEHAYACEIVGCCGLSDGVALFRPVSHDGADLIQIAFLRNDVDDATGAYTERFEAGSFDLPAADLPRSEFGVDLLESDSDILEIARHLPDECPDCLAAVKAYLDCEYVSDGNAPDEKTYRWGDFLEIAGGDARYAAMLVDRTAAGEPEAGLHPETLVDQDIRDGEAFMLAGRPIAPEDAYDLPGTVHGLYKELADNVDRFGMLFRDWRGFAAGTDADDVLRAIDGAFGETEYSRAGTVLGAYADDTFMSPLYVAQDAPRGRAGSRRGDLQRRLPLRMPCRYRRHLRGAHRGPGRASRLLRPDGGRMELRPERDRGLRRLARAHVGARRGGRREGLDLRLRLLLGRDRRARFQPRPGTLPRCDRGRLGGRAERERI